MFQWKAQQPKKCFQILKRTQIMWEPWSDADPESVGPEWSLKVCISSKFRLPPDPGVPVLLTQRSYSGERGSGRPEFNCWPLSTCSPPCKMD